LIILSLSSTLLGVWSTVILRMIPDFDMMKPQESPKLAIEIFPF